MSEQNKLPEEEQVERFALTDEEGNEIEFELIGSGEVDGVMYLFDENGLLIETPKIP